MSAKLVHERIRTAAQSRMECTTGRIVTPVRVDGVEGEVVDGCVGGPGPYRGDLYPGAC